MRTSPITPSSGVLSLVLDRVTAPEKCMQLVAKQVRILRGKLCFIQIGRQKLTAYFHRYIVSFECLSIDIAVTGATNAVPYEVL